MIHLDLLFIPAKTKQFPTHLTAQNLLAKHPRAPLPPKPQLPIPQPIQLNDIDKILAERPRQISN